MVALSDDDRAEIADAAGSVDGDPCDPSVLDEADDEEVFAWAAAWGERVRALTGWSWEGIALPGGAETPGLVAPDRSVVVLPFLLAARAADGEPEACADLTSILERLGRGERPRGEPGTLAVVGGSA